MTQHPRQAQASKKAPDPVLVSTMDAIRPSHDEVARLIANEHTTPHSVLGVHPAKIGDTEGLIARVMHPDATSADLILSPNGERVSLEPIATGLFAAFLADRKLPIQYRVEFHFGDGVWERGDPYRFLPTVGDVDLHLFNEGTHRRLWQTLGAHYRTIDGVEGTAFAVWAPNARRVSVVGEFCGWDGRLLPMRALGASGVFELFVPDVMPGALYKYEIVTPSGQIRLKTDPFAAAMQLSPDTASIVVAPCTYEWGDKQWLQERARREPVREPMLIYEAHLGAWARVPEEGDRWLTYREIAPRLVEHVKRLGFTHIELLPIAEHPFTGSWGYQVTGYYAPTGRYGTPDDFRFFVDTCHAAGIGVIVDWVPAHFPKDDFALRQFDGTALYEHQDPRLGEHPDWGTLIFNYGRSEVRNFLIANALYWLEEFHIDGLRVDAVASMLYLDYSRKQGEWLRNRFGGRENIDAIDFLKTLNETVRLTQPGCVTIAEESTAWPGVTTPVQGGGLGFTFKWNMGWMHDTLEYFAVDPLYRRYHQDRLTFAMMYEYSERFIMPISHDEVVHLKKALLEKMPGDQWQKFANLRLLLAYQYTRPGKKLLFMGTEIGAHREFNHDVSLDWHLKEDPIRQGLARYMERLGQLYNECAPLWRQDASHEGFQWIDVSDRDNSVVSYVRRDGADHVVVVLNLTPVPHHDYRIGVPASGHYVEILSTDDRSFGGSEFETRKEVGADAIPYHGYPQSVSVHLPPLGALVLAPRQMGGDNKGGELNFDLPASK